MTHGETIYEEIGRESTSSEELDGQELEAGISRNTPAVYIEVEIRSMYRAMVVERVIKTGLDVVPLADTEEVVAEELVGKASGGATLGR